ncbi:MAG: NADH-ubiquinone oxidoreductase chain B, partial [uncultured Nocardioidaceae bacterium]
GYRREAAVRRLAQHGRGSGRLLPQGVAMAGDVRPGLLRDRDDDVGRASLRPGEVRHGGVSGVAAAGGPDDRGRTGEPEDGPGSAADLRPDGEPEVRPCHGRLRQQRRNVQQLRDRAGGGSRGAGRHVPPGVPAAPGDAHRLHHEAARRHPAIQAGCAPARRGRVGRAGGTDGDDDGRHAGAAAM